MTTHAVNHRIARLAQLARELEHSHNPEQTMAALQRGFADRDGLHAVIQIATRGLSAGYYRVIRFQENSEPQADVGAPAAGADLSGGVMASILARAEPQLLQDVDWSQDIHWANMLRGTSSVIAVPVSGEHLPMNWVILLKKSPAKFSEADFEGAVERTALVGALLQNQILAAKLAAAHERIDSDARQVGKLQRALLPALLPRITGLDIAASYEPSGRAGGDVYDLFPLVGYGSADAGDGSKCERWCVLIGDASGHGLAAAVVVAIVQAVLRAHPTDADGPAAMLNYANKQLCNKHIGGFCTAFLGVYEPASRRLIYTNAGHPPPIVKHRSGDSVRVLDEALSCPLGIDETEGFAEATVQFEHGDTLLLYTDGITEARDAVGTFFGAEPLTGILRGASGSPAQLIETLRAKVHAHQHDQTAADDQTLVAALIL